MLVVARRIGRNGSAYPLRRGSNRNAPQRHLGKGSRAGLVRPGVNRSGAAVAIIVPGLPAPDTIPLRVRRDCGSPT